MFALVVVAFAFARAAQKWKTGLLALLSFYVHLLEDVMGSRGPDGYQVACLLSGPLSSSPQLAWRGTVGPRAWPNVLIAIVPLLVTLWLAWRRGFSPPKMVSGRRRQFPGHSTTAALSSEGSGLKRFSYGAYPRSFRNFED
jgi:hypothetical protein